MLQAARRNARKQFDAQRGLSLFSEETKNGIAHAEEVAMVLKTNVVQGKRIEGNEKEGEEGGKYRE